MLGPNDSNSWEGTESYGNRFVRFSTEEGAMEAASEAAAEAPKRPERSAMAGSVQRRRDVELAGSNFGKSWKASDINDKILREALRCRLPEVV